MLSSRRGAGGHCGLSAGGQPRHSLHLTALVQLVKEIPEFLFGEVKGAMDSPESESRGASLDGERASPEGKSDSGAVHAASSALPMMKRKSMALHHMWACRHRPGGRVTCCSSWLGCVPPSEHMPIADERAALTLAWWFLCGFVTLHPPWPHSEPSDDDT